MFCVEMVLVEVTICTIMSIELYKIRKHIVKKKSYKVNPQDVANERLMVFAGMPTDEPGSA